MLIRIVSLCVVMVAAVFITAFPAIAAADDLWLVMGPGAGRFEDGRPGGSAVYGAEITIGNEARGSSGIVSLALPGFWVTGGISVIDAVERIYIPYAEAGFWFLLNFGAGYSRSIGGDLGADGLHVFVGMPVPVFTRQQEGHFVMLEPYLRLHRTVEGGYAEFGVLIKYGNRLFR